MRLAVACSTLFLVFTSGAASAQVAPRPAPFEPRLRVAASEKPIDVASVDAHVAIHGLHAETTETVVFFNPNGRVLEGQLEFPMPDGATVSGFALDVDGQLVDGVVVPKDRARVIVETEIRRGVDPGLVEQVRGNVYRTRVYPIPARGTRTVRLRWVSELATRGEEAAYRLPLGFDHPLRSFAIRVEVVRPPVTPVVEGGYGNVALARAGDRWVAENRWADVTPSKDLLVRLPRLPAQIVDVEPSVGGEAFFSVTVLVPAAAPAPAPVAPRRIALAWDGSGSRDPAATSRELAFLEALLARWPRTAVDLVVFRDRREDAVTFEGQDAAKRLVERLRATPSDGGTALGALDLRRAASSRQGVDLWILASDGLATLGDRLPLHGDVPILAVTASSAADRALLRHLATQTGGELVDLAALEPAAAAAEVASPRARLVRVDASPASAVADVQLSPSTDRGRASLTGRLLADEAELSLRFAAGGAVVETRKITVRRAAAARAGEGTGPAATAWAQGRAEALGLFPDANAAELLALGRRFGLVTAGTSLLVLETLAQHLQYQVEPAASRKELRARYLAQLGALEKEKAGRERVRLEEVVRRWQERVRWWETRFDAPAGWRYSEKKAEARGIASAPLAAEAPAPGMPRSAAPRSERMLALADSAAPGEAKVMAREVRKGAEASIAVKPWDPDVPWLEPLRRAGPGGAYAAYLAERARWATSPSFFLDCAGFLLRSGQRDLGLRVLSNLAELRIDDASLLRVLAWRLAQAGDLDLAADVLGKVLRLRPEEPQSRRDLALVLWDRAEARKTADDAERAVALLWDVGRTGWDRFPDTDVVALMELNRIFARAERLGFAPIRSAARVDPRVRKLLDLDLRISLSWDADMTDVDLHVLEPTGEHAFYGHRETRIGGLVSHDVTQGYGPEEYVVHRAARGAYAIKVHYYGSQQQALVGPATMIATVYTNFGRPDEKREVLTLRLGSPRDLEDVGVVRIGSREAVQPARQVVPP